MYPSQLYSPLSLFFRTFYEEGAIMLSEESHILAGILLGLNSIDFRWTYDVSSGVFEPKFLGQLAKICVLTICILMGFVPQQKEQQLLPLKPHQIRPWMYLLVIALVMCHSGFLWLTVWVLFWRKFEILEDKKCNPLCPVRISVIKDLNSKGLNRKNGPISICLHMGPEKGV